VSDIREFRLPDLGEGLEEGEIVEWLVSVGDTIDLNQEVASVETAKAVVEVPSPFAGTVVELIGEPGATIEVGEVFVRIDVSGGAVAADAGDDAATGAVADAAADDQPAPTSTGLDADSEPQPLVGYGNREGGGRRRRRGAAADGPAEDASADTSPAETGGGPVLAKPPVRKLAKDLGVDLAAIAPGSGEGGVITREDVRMAAARTMVAEQAPPPTPAEPQPATPQPAAAGEQASATRRSSVIEALVAAPGGAGEKPVPGFRGRRPGEVEKVAGIRKRIIAKMEQSRRDIPHALCSRDADLTELWHLRRDLTEQAHAQGLEVRISPTALVMRATVLALRRFPTLNAIYDQEAGEIRLLEHIHLGCAVDTDRGLMVPNVKDAHTKSLVQIAAETEQLAQACRDGSATPAQLTGGTFTVDNYGSFGNDDGNPIINAPEVGILGVGVIRERPWVVERGSEPGQGGQIVPRRVARFTLAFDHRVCDGGEAGRFVTYVADLCEQPSRILLHA
jgi:2-oxoisovalerate dehydrogenase E2 component (dihydrolipoyl transacylase)